MNIIIFNETDAEKVAAIMEEMKALGAPSIKAIWVEAYNAYVALNGSHRIVAAKNLGIKPEIEEIEYDDELTTDDLGMNDEFQGDCWLLSDVIDSAARGTIMIEF